MRFHKPWHTRKSNALAPKFQFKPQQNCDRNWRIYKYRDADARDKDIEERVAMKPLILQRDASVDEEKYVGIEPWCYNCAMMGHLGDVSTIENRVLLGD